MAGEEGYFRFFAYLGLFIFMMTILVMGKNLIMLYLGWEGVGLCSYLLIGYYYDRPAAPRGGEEGVPRQPRRRLRVRPGHHALLPGLRHDQLLRRPDASGGLLELAAESAAGAMLWPTSSRTRWSGSRSC